MIDFLRNQIKDKSVLLLGFGREGRSSLRMILKAGGYAKIGIADQAALTSEDIQAIGVFPAMNFGEDTTAANVFPTTNSGEDVFAADIFPMTHYGVADFAADVSPKNAPATGDFSSHDSIGDVPTAGRTATGIITAKDIALHTGPNYQDAMDAYDIVFKSPGIVLKRDISEYTCRIVSQTELFFAKYHDQIVGITGTKGKSTTAALLHHILQSAGRPCMLAGNIGIPVFDHCEEITPDMTIVVELSCHQLEYMTVSSAVGVLINIYEEHLDHYGTMEKYTAAKQQIYRNQRPEDVLFCNVDFLPEPGAAKSRIVTVGLERDADISVYGSEVRIKESVINDCFHDISAAPDFAENIANTGDAADPAPGRHDERYSDPVNFGFGNISRVGPITDKSVNDSGNEICGDPTDEIYRIPTDEINLLGHHNYFDIAIDYGICRLLGLSPEEFTSGLKTYETLPHRLKLIAVKDGVKYYDDSISTIDQTAIEALHTLPDADTILIGGMDRGIDYGALIEYLKTSSVRNIILMEATGRRIYREIMGSSSFPHPERLHLVDHLEDAVALAKKLTRPGHSCILSPAAASYGIFKNFEERGDRFAELVRR